MVGSLSYYHLSQSVIEYIGAVGGEVVKEVGYVSVVIDFVPLSYERERLISYFIRADYSESGYGVEGGLIYRAKKGDSPSFVL